jgi:hypothetical protein
MRLKNTAAMIIKPKSAKGTKRLGRSDRLIGILIMSSVVIIELTNLTICVLKSIANSSYLMGEARQAEFYIVLVNILV